MGVPVIFKGKVAKFLTKAGILIPQRTQLDRSLTPENGEMGYNLTTNKIEVYENNTWVNFATAPQGQDASFANNQSTPADVTGFLAANSLSSKYLVGVYREATANSYETLEVLVVKKSSSYNISVTGVGDDSGVALSITNTGQIQYTSTNVAGHNATNSKIYWKQVAAL